MKSLLLSVFIFSILGFNSFANAKDFDVAFMEKIFQSAQDLPQNKKEAIQSLLKDLSAGETGRLDSLVLNPSAKTHELLIKGLLEGEDSENIIQLIETLENNDEEVFKFLGQLRNRVKDDKDKLDRIRNNMEILYADILATPVITPAIGKRWLQATMITLGAVAVTLSIYPDLIYWYDRGDTQIFLKPQLMLLGLFASASLNEVRVIRSTWKEYKSRLSSRLRAEKNIGYFRKVLNSLKNAPHMLPALDRMKYFASNAAEMAAKDALAEYPSHFAETIEMLKDNSEEWSQLTKFFHSKNFVDLMRRYNSRLFEFEKKQIVEISEGKSIKIPLSIQVEQMAFEHAVIDEFNSWMATEGKMSFTEKFRRVLSK
ncbi:MAG: hypothetical protein KDD22_00035, partial [Bdellovibrionales bacterium]|nr:hypothetical protein [Bdellovibrionales bacterium]